MGRYWLETLGCPKNQVDSDKLEGYLAAQGYDRAADPDSADLVVVNTCAFIEAARQESIDTILDLAERAPGRRPPGRDRLHGRALRRRAARRPARGRPGGRVRSRPDRSRRAAPAGAVPVTLGAARTAPAAGTTPPSTCWTCPAPRPARPGPTSRWPRAATGSAASAPSRRSGASSARARRRGPGRGGRAPRAAPGAPPLREVVLVAQDLASYGRDRSGPGRRTRTADGPSPIAALDPRRLGAGRAHPAALPLPVRPDRRADRGRPGHRRALLRPLAAARVAPAARPHAPLGRRRAVPAAHRRHPGRRARRHLPLLVHPRLPGRDRGRPRPAARVPRTRPSSTGPASSPSPTRTAPTPPGWPTRSPPELALERLRECAELQDAITAARRDRLVGEVRQVLVDAPGRGRTVHEAPEIDGIVHLPGRPRGRRPRRRGHHRRGGPRPPRPARASSGSSYERRRRHERRRPRPPGPPRLHLRAQRARHAGQRRHRGPAARRAGLRR